MHSKILQLKCVPARAAAATRSAAFHTTAPAAAGQNLDHLWMPFTNNRTFKAKPKLYTSAKGMYLYQEDGNEIIDGAAGLWCVNAGHAQPKITEAVQKAAATLDYVPTFNMGCDAPFKLAETMSGLFKPERQLNRVFFTQCGSTAVDSALKIALAYHRSRGQGERVRFIGRDKAYHGVNFGGISVAGLPVNRKAFSGNMLSSVSHLPHYHSLPDMAFSKGQPKWGAHFADELEKIALMNDPSTVAAVIIEPVIGAGGVLPPPVGYLERIREICTKYGLLLIFDEVITGYGRVGGSFATEVFNVTPDMLTCAKGMTNGAVPAGAVIAKQGIYDSIVNAAEAEGNAGPELFHGYTYSGHPLAMAAGLASIEVYQEQKIFEQCAAMAPYFEAGLHSLKGLPHVVDIRNFGLLGSIELAPIPGQASFKRTGDIVARCWEKGLYLRLSGPSLVLSPPLIMEKAHVDRIVSILTEAITESSKEMR